MDSPVCKDSASVRQLLGEVYGELREIASITMDRLPGNTTLQPTALVHEAWLQLERIPPAHWQSRAHFLAAAARRMRHILIDHARRRRAIRHGGGLERESIDELVIPLKMDDDELLLVVGDAVEQLAVQHPDLAELVWLRFIGGFQVTEAGRLLGMTKGTAHRRWNYARVKLYQQVQRAEGRDRQRSVGSTGGRPASKQ